MSTKKPKNAGKPVGEANAFDSPSAKSEKAGNLIHQALTLQDVIQGLPDELKRGGIDIDTVHHAMRSLLVDAMNELNELDNQLYEERRAVSEAA